MTTSIANTNRGQRKLWNMERKIIADNIRWVFLCDYDCNIHRQEWWMFLLTDDFVTRLPQGGDQLMMRIWSVCNDGHALHRYRHGHGRARIEILGACSRFLIIRWISWWKCIVQMVIGTCWPVWRRKEVGWLLIRLIIGQIITIITDNNYWTIAQSGHSKIMKAMYCNVMCNFL